MDINTVYCGDAGELLESLEPGSFDLTVTSPPYDGLRKYNGYIFDFERIARGLYRATKIGGVVVWVVSDQTIKGSETGTSFRQALYFKEIGFNIHDTMIYRRSPPPLTHNRYEQHFEYMFIFSKGKPNTFNGIRVKRANKDNRNRKAFRKEKDNTVDSGYLLSTETVLKGNVWDILAGGGEGRSDEFATAHPAPFPEALARDHIISWSNPGDIVLDPMCGSGTTLKMAWALGRGWIGFDVSAEYCDLARRRVDTAERIIEAKNPEGFKQKSFL